jgi:hypothetical protein
MNVEFTILYAVWAIALFLVFAVPKKLRREASVATLIQQCITWFLGLLAVEWNLIEYPYREFASVNETSFTYEFFAYPVVSSYYVLFYPKKKSSAMGIIYTILFTTALTIPEFALEKYTNLVHYIHWHWYYTWISVFLTLYLLLAIYNWFFKYSVKRV